MAKFSVTYEIWSEDACEAGETDERGFALEGASLRDAVDCVLSTRTSHVGGVECIEPSDSQINHARYFTVTNSIEYLTGEQEIRSLHIPPSVTGASRRRIAQLLGIDC